MKTRRSTSLTRSIAEQAQCSETAPRRTRHQKGKHIHLWKSIGCGRRQGWRSHQDLMENKEKQKTKKHKKETPPSIIWVVKGVKGPRGREKVSKESVGHVAKKGIRNDSARRIPTKRARRAAKPHPKEIQKVAKVLEHGQTTNHTATNSRVGKDTPKVTSRSNGTPKEEGRHEAPIGSMRRLHQQWQHNGIRHGPRAWRP